MRDEKGDMSHNVPLRPLHENFLICRHLSPKAFQISNLIREYSEVVAAQAKSRVAADNAQVLLAQHHQQKIYGQQAQLMNQYQFQQPSSNMKMQATPLIVNDVSTANL